MSEPFRRWRRSLANIGALALVAVLSCARRQSPPRVEANAALGGGIAARVGAQSIPVALVETVASARNLAPREALRRLVDDEIAAAAARARGLDRRPEASWRLASARARFTADRLFQEAKERGAPTDEEIRMLSEKHWLEVDRPPAVRVIHAIVMQPTHAALVDRARSLAGEIRRAVISAVDAEEFERSAKSVPHGSELEVRVERLPAFTEEGLITEGSGAMDEVFAKAAFQVPAVHGTSPVIETKSFGWHVIRLLERIPEKRMPLETKRAAFAEEVYSLRAHDLLQARLAPMRAASHIEISPAAEQLMRSVTTARDERPQAPGER